MLFVSFITYLVVFSLYLVIPMRKNPKRLNRRRRKNILYFDKGKGGVLECG